MFIDKTAVDHFHLDYGCRNPTYKIYYSQNFLRRIFHYCVFKINLNTIWIFSENPVIENVTLN